jgi:YfiH family protein
MHLKSEVLSGIQGLSHGFGTVSETVPTSLEPFWTKAHPSWKQVHGVHHVEVRDPLQGCGEADALVTFQNGIPVAVVTADCVPVLLARQSGGACAAIHAGWRGTFSGAVEEMLKFLQSRGENLSDWVSAIGPAIGPCCYEVSEELVSDFQRKFEALPPSLISPAFRRLDLPAIHEARLRSAGLKQVELIRACTQCSAGPLFHSFRREKNKNRQYSGLVFSG